MKKAKIMLSVIMVFTIAASVMAFKAKKYGALCLYTMVDNPGTVNDFCQLFDNNLYWWTVVGGILTNGQVVAFTPGQTTCEAFDPISQPDGASPTLPSGNCPGQTRITPE